MSKQFVCFLVISQMILPSVGLGAPFFDGSGAPGADAQHGHSPGGQAASGWTGSNGSDGDDGGRAGFAQDGTNGKDIKIKIGSAAQKGEFILSGAVETKGNLGPVTLRLNEAGSIIVQSRGGKGGDGGIGGDGQRGGDGGNGSSATHYSSGGNGGNGGRGGDAGAGSSGGNGGNGGNLTIELPEKLTHALLLVEADISGGPGGKAGRHGQPGSGGLGGWGGSSYSWTETVIGTETVSTTDTNGNTTYETRPTTETVTHSQPGGWNGSSGSSGSIPNQVLSAGVDGASGKVEFRVLEGDGQVHIYRQMYNLKLIDYKIDSANHDGILEPGERVSIRNLRVENFGEMPTPPNAKIRIALANGKYLVADSKTLTLPKSLKRGETFEFVNETLDFTVEQNTFSGHSEERFVVSDHIQPLADVVEVERSLKGFAPSEQISITMPIEIEPVSAVRALSQGESSRLMLRIKNISGRDFGSESSLRRSVALALHRTGGVISPDKFKVTDLNGRSFDLANGFVKAIAYLKAGETALIEGIVSVASDAGSYQGAEVDFDLKLQLVSGESTVIQSRRVGFRAVETYKMAADTDVLIVANSSMESYAMRAWKEKIQQLGSKVAVWDISYHGTLALTQALATGSSLARDFAGKTIVVLASDFQDAHGSSRNTYEFFQRAEFLKVAANLGTDIVVFGPAQTRFFESLIEITPGKVESKSTLFSEMIKDLEIDRTMFAEEDFKGRFSELVLTKFSLWGNKKSMQRSLDRWAEKLRYRLSQKFPERNYSVVVNFAPRLAKKGLFNSIFASQWNIGNILVQRTLDSTHGKIVGVDVPVERINTLRGVENGEMTKALLLGMSIEKKLDVFSRVAEGKVNPAILPMLSEAIVAELALEQATIRRLKWSFGLSRSQLQTRLGKLLAVEKWALAAKSGNLSDFRLSLNSNPQATEAMVDILSSVQAMGKSEMTWVDWIVPFRRNAQAQRATDRIVRSIWTKVFQPGIISNEMISTSAKRAAEKLRAPEGTPRSSIRVATAELDRLIYPAGNAKTAVLTSKEAERLATKQNAGGSVSLLDGSSTSLRMRNAGGLCQQIFAN